MTQTESGPSGQFRGTINDESTEEEGEREWNAFLRVYRNIFRVSPHTNPNPNPDTAGKVSYQKKWWRRFGVYTLEKSKRY